MFSGFCTNFYKGNENKGLGGKVRTDAKNILSNILDSLGLAKAKVTIQ
jgi:hypothetical protein